MHVTQNIDDFHCQLIKQSEVLKKAEDKHLKFTEAEYDEVGNKFKWTTRPLPKHNNGAFTPHVYEIHGNVLYMHCSDVESDHADVFLKSPLLSEVKDRKNHVPRCPTCDKVMKPHCMFFDEMYSERYYRRETVESFYSEADCCIVVGTALQTGFAAKIVNSFLRKELPVIEINLESSIDRGNNIQVLGKAERTLPDLFNEYYRLVKQPEESKVAKTPQKPSQTKSVKPPNAKPAKVSPPVK
jgi:NAD-dependent deacetylase